MELYNSWTQLPIVFSFTYGQLGAQRDGKSLFIESFFVSYYLLSAFEKRKHRKENQQHLRGCWEIR